MPKTKAVRKRDGNVFHINPIRVETELSGFPVHNLTKRGNAFIDIGGHDKAGREFSWSVAPNSKFGHPAELAYKLDTLIINRRLDQAGREKPKVIALGSLREICRELAVNEGQAVRDIKQAFLQNASVFISAKLTYTDVVGVEYYFEFGATRYNIYFTGQKLPNGQKADQVYIIFNDLYLSLLNTAKHRPLDYEYLKSLPPTPQRFYELIAPKMFAAIKHKLPYAKYFYSHYCTFSAQIRYYEREKMRKQMYKVLKPHRDSSYIESVTYKAVIDGEGKADWEILAVPGRKAQQEYQAFTTRRENTSSHSKVKTLLPQPASINPSTEYDILTKKLTELGVSHSTAQSLADNHPEQAALWLDVVETHHLSKNIKDRGAYLTKAITTAYQTPASYRKAKEAAERPQETSVERHSTPAAKFNMDEYKNSDHYKLAVAKIHRKRI